MTTAPDPTTPAAADRAPIPFTRWRWYGFGFTLATLLVTALSLATYGLNLGLDFTGGVLVEARSAAGFEAGALRAALEEVGVSDAAVQTADEGRKVFVRARIVEGFDSVAAITAALGPEATIDKADVIGPKVSGELFRSGLTAAVLAVVMIAIYVWFRFESKFGAAAFITTFHDVALVFGLFSLTGMTFDLSTIAAVLALAGYSINDTVVVFDRIRETLGRLPEAELEEVIDRSITETLRRTIATAGTTVLTTVAIMLFGGPVLFGFAAAVTFGIVIGTYSSIFVAAPLLIHLPGKLPGRGKAPEAAPETEAPTPSAG